MRKRAESRMKREGREKERGNEKMVKEVTYLMDRRKGSVRRGDNRVLCCFPDTTGPYWRSSASCKPATTSTWHMWHVDGPLFTHAPTTRTNTHSLCRYDMKIVFAVSRTIRITSRLNYTIDIQREGQCRGLRTFPRGDFMCRFTTTTSRWTHPHVAEHTMRRRGRPRVRVTSWISRSSLSGRHSPIGQVHVGFTWWKNNQL